MTPHIKIEAAYSLVLKDNARLRSQLRWTQFGFFLFAVGTLTKELLSWLG